MPLYELDGVGVDLPGEDCFVAPDAALIGKVRLKAEASVWFNAVLRGDNEWIELGERTNVQDLSMCHTDMGYPLTIGDDCTVGHRAVLHGCTIGNNCLIGIGAVLMNGVSIGDNCVIGAGALLTENKQIPANSLVIGAPGRIMRQVKPEEVERVRQSAAHYAENSRRYRAGLAPMS